MKKVLFLIGLILSIANTAHTETAVTINKTDNYNMDYCSTVDADGKILTFAYQVAEITIVHDGCTDGSSQLFLKDNETAFTGNELYLKDGETYHQKYLRTRKLKLKASAGDTISFRIRAVR